MRHLFYTGSFHTVCGLVRGNVPNIHVSKGRKTDCFVCRLRFRARIRDSRPPEKRYVTLAEKQKRGR